MGLGVSRGQITQYICKQIQEDNIKMGSSSYCFSQDLGKGGMMDSFNCQLDMTWNNLESLEEGQSILDCPNEHSCISVTLTNMGRPSLNLVAPPARLGPWAG